jgi:cell division protease FtsH
VRRIVMDAFERTTAWLQLRRDALQRGARERLARETLDEAALKLPAAQHAASG